MGRPRSHRTAVWLPLAVLALVVVATGVQAARLRTKIFGSDASALDSRVASSDPANTPMSVDAFLQGSEAPLVQAWGQAVEEAPRTHHIDQDVIMHTQAQQMQQQQQQQSQPGSVAAFLEQGWIEEGKHAKDYEPKDWPRQAITPDPYQHLTHRQGGGSNDHNNIEGALGVQSAAIPWDYRHYSGHLNSHRKAEPLIYTPLVIAKDQEGNSAIDLTSLVNRKYQSQRMSSNPQYANTLSALTDYRPIQLHPTDHWLPQMPTQQPAGITNPKYWEKHFLDLNAPTPPPLLSPVPPRMKQRRRPISLLQTQAQAVVLPDVLRHGEHVQPLITQMLDANQQPIAFHDQLAEEQQIMHEREVDIFAPTHAEEQSFLETEVEIGSDLELNQEEQEELDALIEMEDLDLE